MASHPTPRNRTPSCRLESPSRIGDRFDNEHVRDALAVRRRDPNAGHLLTKTLLNGFDPRGSALFSTPAPQPTRPTPRFPGLSPPRCLPRHSATFAMEG